MDNCSCSADFSVRMWTLGGRYLQTIGTFKPWKPIAPGVPIPEDFAFTVPADIKRIASSTTLRVLCGGSFPKRLTIKQLQKQAQKDLIHVDHKKIYGEMLRRPFLGHYYNIPEKTAKQKDVEFDPTFSYVSTFLLLLMFL